MVLKSKVPDERLRVLYVGDLWPGSTSLQRYIAFEDIGFEVIGIDTSPPGAGTRRPTFAERLRRRILGPTDLCGANQSIERQMSKREFDIVWLDKALTITVETFRSIRQAQPNCQVIGYSPDDMAGAHNQSKHFLQTLPDYDAFFTTKSFGVAELSALGCKRPIHIENAYDPHTHWPRAADKATRLAFGAPVGFVGAYERERWELMRMIAEHGMEVRVWGEGWRKKHACHPRLRIECHPLWGDDYARAVCSFDINLGFLRKLNRDLQTHRSIEIPACAAFMLAERTSEHSQLFVEGKEAEFFSSPDELLQKAEFYLSHPGQRERIAAAGRERCLLSGYDNVSRLRQMLKAMHHAVGPSPTGVSPVNDATRARARQR